MALRRLAMQVGHHCMALRQTCLRGLPAVLLQAIIRPALRRPAIIRHRRGRYRLTSYILGTAVAAGIEEGSGGTAVPPAAITLRVMWSRW